MNAILFSLSQCLFTAEKCFGYLRICHSAKVNLDLLFTYKTAILSPGFL